MKAAPAAAPAAKPYWLYLLECADGTYYAGIARDVCDRFMRHAAGAGAKYTRAHPPGRIRATHRYPSVGDALRAEYALKQLPKSSKLGFFEPADRAPEETPVRLERQRERATG